MEEKIQKDLFCELCSLQFERKSLQNKHMKEFHSSRIEIAQKSMENKIFTEDKNSISSSSENYT